MCILFKCVFCLARKDITINHFNTTHVTIPALCCTSVVQVDVIVSLFFTFPKPLSTKYISLFQKRKLWAFISYDIEHMNSNSIWSPISMPSRVSTNLHFTSSFHHLHRVKDWAICTGVNCVLLSLENAQNGDIAVTKH